ncbi:uncharacterized protein BCR38DRAFT_70978 [Pseudomassariella vexata]|uniref:Zn(2)-C6 fungal-type domain-containing protein n=1 Tax=Pseudomassariella vexata TaxID=1141098 RepID=A0A1Y2DI07_9PEZI|nr:uncharacterized protein BCR38DRAFT_70978 [Pseudomassariella vexata]ORY58867.1 hypothetical protein BCR38DRAFT_70978 [Pseudomassariella vexata]
MMVDLGHRNGRLTISSRSCDACRTRKVRCEMSSPVLAEAEPCKRCARLSVTCTFDIPTRTRGPRRRDERREGSNNNPGSLGFPQLGTKEASLQYSPASNSRGGPAALAAPGFSPQSSTSSTFELATKPVYPTDALCSRRLFKRILRDYIRFIYPLIPVVHRPSFRNDLDQDRDLHDDVFLGLAFALCAVVVGIMPSRFDSYHTHNPPLRFTSRLETINCCYDLLMGLRGPTYFDEINYQKFAVAYLMSIAFFQLGEQNRSRMMEVEAMQLGRLLHLHKKSEYEGLNCIEKQLRKKGFWLLFYGYVHSQLQNLRREKLNFLDPIWLSSTNIEELLPLEVDDEMIHEDSVLAPEPGTTCLTSGFIIHSKVFRAALVPALQAHRSGDIGESCQCRRAQDVSANIAHLTARLQELSYMLDNTIPPPLRQWAHTPTTESHDGDSVPTAVAPDLLENAVESQFASMRANLHVTHLWLQSIVIDQLDSAEAAASTASDYNVNAHRRKLLWRQREDICRQLLHVLHGLPESALEPNGLHLAFKVRDVAVGLLACPYDEDEMAAKRAGEYIRELTVILSRLDQSEKMNTANLQSWIDTDRIKDGTTHGGTSQNDHW